MSLTFKQIADAVCLEIGISVQDQYFGNSNTALQRLGALANRSIKVLTQDNWQGLRTEGSITLTTATEYDLPAGTRYIVPDTMQAQDQERFVKFPTSDAEWWYLKSRTGPNGIRYKVRFYGDKLQVEDPQADIVLIFEYITENVITSTGSVVPDKARFTVDTDTWLLDDDLLIMDLKWRYMKTLGIEGWEIEYKEFKLYEKVHRGKEPGARTLNMGVKVESNFPTPYFDLYQ